MGEKDITEKTLEAYNDVFSDIVNVLLFNGKQVVDPDDLEDRTPLSFYKADGKIRELERDVAKRWKKQNIRIACIGLENQTDPDPYMALRVAGYDGTEYRAQMINLQEGEKPYPVITIVLYFGYEHHWNQPTTLYESLEIADEFKPYVNDLKINLFEIAWLTREQVNMFKSDFRIVADYFVQMRENGEYKPGTEEVQHIQAVLQLLNVMDKEKRFEIKINEEVEKGKVNTMSEWLDKVIKTSEANGETRGEARGEARGESKMGRLMLQLFKQGRTDDADKATKDPEYRQKLYQEFQIA